MNLHRQILIVDDDHSLHTMYQHILANRNYHFLSVTNPLAGLKILEDENIDVILLDMTMPDINGIEFLTLYHQNPQLASIPAIIISAISDREQIAEAYNRGAFACLAKPFSAPELIRTVQAALGDERIPLNPASEPDQSPLEEKLSSAWSRLSFFHHITRQMRHLEDPQALILDALQNAGQLLGTQHAGLVTMGDKSARGVWNSEGFSRIDQQQFIAAIEHVKPQQLICQDKAACQRILPQVANLYNMVGQQLNLSQGGPCYLFIANKQNQMSFNAGDILFFESLAEQITTIIEISALQSQSLRNQQIKHELQVAAEIQTRFLAQDLGLGESFEAAARLISASQVGGDFYDASRQQDSSLLFLCDVAGKGIPAALVAAELRIAIRASLQQNPYEPGAILFQANKLLYESLGRTDYMATACIAQFQDGSNLLRYASAGHTSALLYKKQAEDISKLESTSFPLGLFPEIDARHTEHLIEPGDVLLLYSDGLSEAENLAGEIMGMGRISDVMMATHSAPAERIQEYLIYANRVFRGRNPNMDDMTTLVIKCPDPAAEAILQTHYLYLSSDLQNLPRIDQALREICSGLARSDKLDYWLMEVVLAATENLSNIIRHSQNKIRPDVHIFMALYADHLVIHLYDSGDAYQKKDRPPLHIDMANLPEGGYGLHLIHQIMDEVRCERIGEIYNHWRLMRYLPTVTEAATP